MIRPGRIPEFLRLSPPFFVRVGLALLPNSIGELKASKHPSPPPGKPSSIPQCANVRYVGTMVTTVYTVAGLLGVDYLKLDERRYVTGVCGEECSKVTIDVVIEAAVECGHHGTIT